MNKFNKKTVNSIKVRRDNARVKKKRIGTVKGHKKGVAAVSGARTGKAQRRKERQQRLKVRIVLNKVLPQKLSRRTLPRLEVQAVLLL